MNLQEILDQILIPRPNGSDNLENTADFLSSFLANHGAAVSEHTFTATPHGFQIMWTAAVIIMAGYCWAILTRRYAVAAVLPLLLAVVLLLEFEMLISTFSLLSTTIERNIVGTYPGVDGGPLLIFTAHYDTTTHFGDHFSWGLWGGLQGPATGIAVALAIAGLILQRKNKTIPTKIAVAILPFTVIPFLALFWFQSIGPIVREPSIGAVDNGGAMASLLLLAKEMGKRPEGSLSTVKIVFLASEEERTLGAWAYAASLLAEHEDDLKKTVIINVESIGTTDDLAYIPEDGFATKRYKSSPQVISFVNSAAKAVYGKPLEARPLPFGTLTDARIFLAFGMESITLRSNDELAFPTRLHSHHDSRDRLKPESLEKSARLLKQMVRQVDKSRVVRNSVKQDAQEE